MSERKPCPRRVEGPFVSNDFQYLNRPDDGTCDYCGSLDGDAFMARLEAGDVIVVPTDKNYKVYVCNDGGRPFRQTYREDTEKSRRQEAAANLRQLRCNHDFQGKLGGPCVKCGKRSSDAEPTEAQRDDALAYERGDKLDPMDQRHWKWVTREVSQAKFYFQQLSEEQKKRFVELLNAKKIKLDLPGYSYRLPYFITWSPPAPQ